MLRIAIVEDNERDEQILRDYLSQYAAEYGRKIQIQTFRDGDEIVTYSQTDFDLIFMDIQMQFMDGITAAKHIRKRDEDVTIIFVTNMAQFAIHGYEVNALDYIVKPINYFAFARILERAAGKISKQKKRYITVSSAGILTKLEVSNIRYIESHGHHLTFHLTNKKCSTSNISMKEIEQRLQKFGFFRCSKSYLVNLDHVESIEQHTAFLGENQIPISRLKKKEFWEALTNYVAG